MRVRKRKQDRPARKPEGLDADSFPWHSHLNSSYHSASRLAAMGAFAILGVGVTVRRLWWRRLFGLP